MKGYPEYKDSGVEWIGEIPEHWPIKKLKYIANLVLGKMLTPDDKGGYYKKPYLRAQNILWEHVDISDVKEMWFSEKELDQYRLHVDDLLVSEGGEVGRTAIWRNELEECYIQNSVHKITVNGHLNPKYFLHLLATYGKRGHFNAIVNKVSIGHLTKEKLENIEVISPPSEDQELIARHLDHKTHLIDSLIEKKRKQIELFQEQRSAIINHAVTKGLNPNVKMKDSGIEWIGEVPYHWEIKRLKWLIRERLKYGANESAELNDVSLPRYIRITDFSEAGTLRDNTFRSLPWEKATDYMLNDGDILFARSGATVGKTFQFKNYPGRACYAGYLIKATPDQKKMESDFLYYFTRTSCYENWKNSIFIQATIQNIGADKYQNLSVPVPSLHEQVSIVDFVKSEAARIQRQIDIIRKSIQLLSEYRTTLISEVVTGKIDVREEAVP